MRDQTLYLRPTVIAGAAVALVMAVTGILAPVLATHDPNAVNQRTIFAPPGGYADGGSIHVLGTDYLGRDVLSRVVASFRNYLYIGLLGTFLGVLAAWLLVIALSIGGAPPAPNFLPSLLVLPFYGLAIVTFIVGVSMSIVVMASMGPAIVHVIVCAGVFSAFLPMTLVYESVRKDGASSSPIRLAARRGIVLFPATFSLALLMGFFIESSLSFLGVGVPPSTPSLGGMISAARYSSELWWLWGFPLGVVLATVGAFLAIVIPVGRGLTRPAGAVLPTQAGTPAGFWIRLAAYLIDLAAIILCFILLSYVLNNMIGPPFAFAGAVLIIVVIAALVGIPAVSPGKRTLGLHVLRPDGSRAGLGRKFCRSLAQMLSGLIFYVGFLMIAFRKDKRGLHDLICDTVIVRWRGAGAVEPVQNIPDTGEISQPSAQILPGVDI